MLTLFQSLFLATILNCERTNLSALLKKDPLEGLRHMSACTYQPQIPKGVKSWAEKSLSLHRDLIKQKARGWLLEIYMAQLLYKMETKKTPTLAVLVKEKRLPKPNEKLTYFFHVVQLGKGKNKKFYLEGRHAPVFGEFIEVSRSQLPRRPVKKRSSQSGQ